MPHHLTAFVRFRFRQPELKGRVLRVTYSESYGDEPRRIPWERRNGNRCDYTKSIYSPIDIYEFRWKRNPCGNLGYYADEMEQEIFMPFHWKTFRFIRLNIDVGSTDLVFDGVEIETVNYPLEAEAQIIVSGDDAFVENFWTAGIRTFENCMLDCYEDCPFSERMQYAMGTRSMSLFTYLLSGDDQLARQAIRSTA
ncbi:unnamed protein product [Clonostachys rosea f. rosea IK726]|uniref:Uncharacterized protein n=1 Tax=Clonostachys rosea f. rosea IK726 TaxID=1349383 RepID=A0ACA9U8V0_BIOOC|nr:unnamed protein product [Clonostachys rosea f. rosea IK726]